MLIRYFKIKVPGSHTEEPSAEDVDPIDLYPAHNISVPIDHFHNESKYAPHSNETFPLRYWFDASHYQKGGPVIILSAGETDGAGEISVIIQMWEVRSKLTRSTHTFRTATIPPERYPGSIGSGN